MTTNKDEPGRVLERLTVESVEKEAYKEKVGLLADVHSPA